MNTKRAQLGLTLVELMVGITVGMFVVAGVTAVYVGTIRGSADNLRMARLNQELRAAMDIMVNDIRRAGYWSCGIDATSPCDTIIADLQTAGIDGNPFSWVDTSTATNHTDITILEDGSCILYSYDADSAGMPTSPGHFFGFRQTGNVVQMRTGGTTTSACNDGTWSTLTDPGTVSITSLAFSTVGARCLNTTTGASWLVATVGTTTAACLDTTAAGYVAPLSGHQLIEIRQITVAMQGTHASDSAIQMELSTEIKLRNNRLLVAP